MSPVWNERLSFPRPSVRVSERSVCVCVQAGSGSPTMAANNQDFQRSESDRLNEVKGHLEIALLEKHFLREYTQIPQLITPLQKCLVYWCRGIVGVISQKVPFRLYYCDVIVAAEKHTRKYNLMINVCSRKIFHVSPKSWSALRLRPLSTRTLVKLVSCQRGDTGCPILPRVLIVCNRLWSPPSLPPSLPLYPRGWEPVSAEKEYLGLFPFTQPLLEPPRRDSVSHGRGGLSTGFPFPEPSPLLPLPSTSLFCLSKLAVTARTQQSACRCPLYWRAFSSLFPSALGDGLNTQPETHFYKTCDSVNIYSGCCVSSCSFIGAQIFSVGIPGAVTPPPPIMRFHHFCYCWSLHLFSRVIVPRPNTDAWQSIST